MTFDARTNIDFQESATEILAANSLAVDDDEVRVGRRALFLNASQGQTTAELFRLDRGVALDPDGVEKLLPRMVNDFVAATS
ncbi:MAG TPA: hypothetical protein VIV40_00930 [Kofleriaceae bacterium]